jgi:hypothetical protein
MHDVSVLDDGLMLLLPLVTTVYPLVDVRRGSALTRLMTFAKVKIPGGRDMRG